jgi:hypothetical protein
MTLAERDVREISGARIAIETFAAQVVASAPARSRTPRIVSGASP